ncbi:hypothetical protein SYNPS1DRAFT_26817 [Syncephalis pseudoplumigaleata]|uniref:Uncharacterized protein n=1 Tax=Syncephalis pseudoplumigaleata TaxID=1712513 RepID=A0A4P9Z6P0_9FUNG|nr:hypothetical protein SYNPS1DRAFT_26817 [Syncephalis pseudoplumigaleata]|eukprot:RKP27521.1 hypothetical protein SYNPS1DRAFT_26817 [Syncephalis pseudoplumigaleata]
MTTPHRLDGLRQSKCGQTPKSIIALRSPSSIAMTSIISNSSSNSKATAQPPSSLSDKPQPPLPAMASPPPPPPAKSPSRGPFASIKEGEYEVVDDGSGVPSLERVWFTFGIVPSAKESAATSHAQSQQGPRGYTIRRRFMDFRSYGCLLCTHFGDNPALLHSISDLADNTICNEPGNDYSLPSIQNDLKHFVDGLLKLPASVLYARPSMEFFGIWPSDLQASGNCVAFTNAVGEQWLNAPRSVDHPSLKAHRRSRSMNEEPRPRSRRHFQANKIGLPQLVGSSAVVAGTARDEYATASGHAKSNSLNAISGRLARALNRSRPSDSFSTADSSFENTSSDDITWPIDTPDHFLRVAGVPEEEAFDVAALVSDYSYAGGLPSDEEARRGKGASRKGSADSGSTATSQGSHASGKGSASGPHPLGSMKQAAKSQPNLTCKPMQDALPPLPPLQALNVSIDEKKNTSGAHVHFGNLAAEVSGSTLDDTSLESLEGHSLPLPGTDAHKRISGFTELLDLYGPLKSREPVVATEELLTPSTAVAVPVEGGAEARRSVASVEEVPLKISVVQWRFKKPLNLYVPYDIDYSTLHDVVEFELRKRGYIEKDAHDTRIMIWTAPNDGSRSKRVLGDRTLSKEIDQCCGELRLRCEIAYSQPRQHRKARAVPIVGPPPRQARWRQSSMEQVEDSNLLKSHYISKPKSVLSSNSSGNGASRPQGRRPSVVAKLETIHSNEALVDVDLGSQPESPQPAANDKQTPADKPSTTASVLKKPAPLQIAPPSKATAPKVPHPRKSAARRSKPTPVGRSTPGTPGKQPSTLKMATSGFEEHRRRRLAASATAAAALASSNASGYPKAHNNNNNGSSNKAADATVDSNGDDSTQAVRFRVKKNADYGTLKSAVYRSLLRENLPAEVLAGRTLVFRCPDGSTIPLTDDKAVTAAFKQCKGKVTLTCI